jgi:hypothetical protein
MAFAKKLRQVSCEVVRSEYREELKTGKNCLEKPTWCDSRNLNGWLGRKERQSREKRRTAHAESKNAFGHCI